MSKAELLAQVWAGLVVEENNLQVQVSALRKVLGADVIGTIPGIGYRFTRALDDRVDASVTVDTAPELTPLLPSPVPSLIGRDDDQASLLTMLQAHRLVTLTGPGGMGKSSLAASVAQAWQAAAEVAWVDLANVLQLEGVLPALAQALNGRPDADASWGSVLTLLASAARSGGPLLVVLDHAEAQSGAAADLVQRMRARAPDVCVLVVSQVRLKVAGEWVYRLGALATPEPGQGAQQALRCAALALFVEQAQASGARLSLTDASIQRMSSLCRSLDGVPLAIKIAASRVALLGVEALIDLLHERLHLLTSDVASVPQRQQTLLATLDWSHGLLSPDEQAVFRLLGVLRGTFSLDCALGFLAEAGVDRWEAIDRLGGLVDRSLVMVACEDPPRYRLLESARLHASLKLQSSGQLSQAERWHAQAMSRWMDQAFEQHLCMPDASWLRRHAQDIDNVRAALDWATGHEPDLGVSLLGASVCLFLSLGLAAEARRRAAALETAAREGAGGGVATRGRFWIEVSRLHWGVSHQRMHELAHEGWLRYRQAGHAVGTYQALRCLLGSAVVTSSQRDAWVQEMHQLEDPRWPPRVRAQGLFAQVSVALAQGQTEPVLAAAQALKTLSDQAGFTVSAAAALSILGGVHLSCGQEAEAIAAAQAVLARPALAGSSFAIHAHGVLAQAHLLAARWPQARLAVEALVEAALALEGEWLCLYADVLALHAASESRLESAARLLGHATRVDPLMRQMINGRPDCSPWVRDRLNGALPEATLACWMAQGAAMDGEAVRACVWA